MTNASLQKRRYLALWFPFLPADRLKLDRQAAERKNHCALSPDAPHLEASVVLIAKIKGALRIDAVGPDAAELGLAPGMALADARALYPALQVADADPAGDAALLAQLARRCIAFSPLVEERAPDALRIDISGCTHRFGGEADMAAAVRSDIEAQGMTVRHALADTAEAALALAQWGHGNIADEAAAIAALPAAALGLDDEQTRVFERAGLKTIGAIAARPMASIAARFGAQTVFALQCLLGESRSPLIAVQPKTRITANRRFAEPIAHVETVTDIIAQLAEEAARALEERKAGGREFGIELFRSDGVVRRMSIATGLPTRDPATIIRLLEERIDALSDPIDPGFGFDSISFHVLRDEVLAASQPALDGKSCDSPATDLVDRLSTRIGPGRIRRIVPQDSHIPEKAQRALPAIHHPQTPAWPAPQPQEPPSRPLFLLDPPQPVEVVMVEVPDGPPRQFRWKGKLHIMRGFEGPERIGAEWWRRRDSGGRIRDYYRVEDMAGHRFWLFRHGMYDETPDPGWYLHGLFA